MLIKYQEHPKHCNCQTCGSVNHSTKNSIPIKTCYQKNWFALMVDDYGKDIWVDRNLFENCVKKNLRIGDVYENETGLFSLKIYRITMYKNGEILIKFAKTKNPSKKISYFLNYFHSVIRSEALRKTRRESVGLFWKIVSVYDRLLYGRIA